MALGIGATTAIYSVIDATLLHPLPYPNPAELVRIQDDLPGVGAQDVGISVPEWRDLESSGIFQSVSITGTGADVNLTGSAQPVRLSFKQVTPNYFAVLGVDAQLGRTFDPHDATPGFNLEVVISDGLWRREFGADPHILGKALRLDNDVYHVVGVMPRGFRDQGSTSEEQNVELWLGAGFAGLPFPPPLRGSRLHSRAVIARLKPGLSIAAAQGHLDALVESLKKQYPAEYPAQAAWTVRLIPLSESVVGSVRQSLILLFGAVGLVLLISCVNVANLLLARASVRGREIAVRQALGAQRTRLIRQLLTESLLLFLLGGIAGFAILFCAQAFPAAACSGEPPAPQRHLDQLGRAGVRSRRLRRSRNRLWACSRVAHEPCRFDRYASAGRTRLQRFTGNARAPARFWSSVNWRSPWC